MSTEQGMRALPGHGGLDWPSSTAFLSWGLVSQVNGEEGLLQVPSQSWPVLQMAAGCGQQSPSRMSTLRGHPH